VIDPFPAGYNFQWIKQDLYNVDSASLMRVGYSDLFTIVITGRITLEQLQPKIIYAIPSASKMVEQPAKNRSDLVLYRSITELL
jgi:hypothetical protein